MPSAVYATNGSIPHVPAWKKLGLKLKYAKDVVEDNPTNASRGVKRKEPEHDSVANSVGTLKVPSSVESKKAKKAAKKERRSSAPDSTQDSNEDDPKLKKRKSVTFTPETKIRDGDLLEPLYQDGEGEDGPANLHPDIQEANAKVELKDIANVQKSEAAETSKDIKRPKKPKKPKTKPDVTSIPPHPALLYIQQHHQSRSTWKFSKARQSYILKHFFDITKIPLTYEVALINYITTLQSPGARSRLLETARQVRSEDDVDDSTKTDAASKMDEEDQRRREEYVAALADFLAKTQAGLDQHGIDYLSTPEAASAFPPSLHPKSLSQLKRRRRAETALWALTQARPDPRRSISPSSSDNDQLGSSQKRRRLEPTPAPGLERTPRRRRKQRTTAASDDDSDESSDSTDSSSGTSSTSGSSSDSDSVTESDSSSNGDTSSSGTSSSSSSSASSSSGSGEDESDSDVSSGSSESE
ncbi:MAG: hypothetical protein M1833_005215 [Piccolia ochrophora]|nr:MAG: hypothetical protein M1833_005215 [Piccolia ochrophora]